MVNVRGLAANVERDAHGLWVARNRSAVSYPAADNDVCYQIEDTSFWFEHRNRSIVECVRLHPPAGAIFDIGGGNGFVSLALHKAGWDTVVVEPGAAGAANARRRGLPDVICSTFEDAGFERKALPAVGMFDVLEHVEDEAGFLRKLHESMVPGGQLYLTVPAYPWLWSAEDTYAGHFRRYTLGSLRARLEEAGFACEFSTYLFAILPLPLFLLRRVPYLLGSKTIATSKNAARDHAAGHLDKLLSRTFAWEQNWLRRQRSIPFGSSCLVAAKARP